MNSLDGVALVTGAGSGIGRHLCLAYANAGCRAVVLADLNTQGMHETRSTLEERGYTGRTLVLETNVEDPVSVKNMVTRAIQTFNSLDYAANCAGITTTARTPTARYPHDEYDKILSVNTKGIMLCMQEEIHAMSVQTPSCTPGVNNPVRAQRGSIVNIASVTSHAALQNMMPYNVSKHAVIGLTKSAAVDHACQLIRVNAMCPGMVDTPLVAARGALTKAGKISNWATEGNGMQRLAMAEEVADVCVFLSGCGASYMSGSEVVIDAGHLAALRYEHGLSGGMEKA